ncbi:MAG: uracil-DNA glycosylase family protein [Rhodospirillaceae bacterium]|nr:uracil-DNA glycosylase family protein [Rhodospirillaceae bacterium]
MTRLDDLLQQVRACTLCADHLPLGPRPVLRVKASARILIIGQAPGTKVHETGLPWNDRSGDRLRDWLGVDREIFYDERRIAIMPMGFCYPGVDKNGGDAPPRPECAPTWHPQLWPFLKKVELVLLVGSYAQARYLAGRRKTTMTDTVRAWRTYGPKFLPLPHPSWRNTGWLKKNPWFEAELAPNLKRKVKKLLI